MDPPSTPSTGEADDFTFLHKRCGETFSQHSRVQVQCVQRVQPSPSSRPQAPLNSFRFRNIQKTEIGPGWTGCNNVTCAAESLGSCFCGAQVSDLRERGLLSAPERSSRPLIWAFRIRFSALFLLVDRVKGKLDCRLIEAMEKAIRRD
jgi:hypothetical protein